MSPTIRGSRATRRGPPIVYGRLAVVSRPLGPADRVGGRNGGHPLRSGPGPGETEQGISRSTLRTLILETCRAAAEAETLIVYFSGHGGPFNGKDYLIPSDANLSDPEYIVEDLLPVDVIATAARDCRAETILFVVDACREGVKRTPAGISTKLPAKPCPTIPG